jgi:Zn-dependent protease with chaperone function
MDFFDRQDKARRKSKVLVFYFTIAVVLLIFAVYGAVSVIFLGTGFKDTIGEGPRSWWEPELFLWTAVATLIVILIGSVSKTLQLARGGSAVAELLDGRLLNSNARDPQERKLLNVVEEMAIASGVPVPQVYLLENESGINAFAAGHSPSDAAIGVTSGCMTLLSRDELQGVIGHEFSHILNGDMRLNLRLMGLIFGILCLTVIGRILLRTRGRKNPLPVLGLALVIIGWIGVFFGRLIQAAVSRHREFLADASSAQFTRNPAGLAGALKKIGGLATGSRLETPHAEEASHLFFANGLGDSLFGLMATHPSLTERIRALDPSFDGKFPSVAIEPVSHVTAAAPKVVPAAPIPFPGFPPAPADAAALTSPIVPAAAVVPNIGQPTTQHLRYAVDLRNAISPILASAVRDPFSASAVICALLLSRDAEARQTQLAELARITSDTIRQETLRIWPEVQKVSVPAKIPLVDLALPALRRLSPPQFQQFRIALFTLVQSDKQIDLFEFVLQKILVRHLEPYFVPARGTITQYYSLRPLVNDCDVLLSAIAYAGHKNAAQAHAAFTRGAEQLSRVAQCEIPFLPPEQCDLSKVQSSIGRLSGAVPQIKKNLLNACAQTVAVDGVIQEGEAELLRAIADTLDCPLPPFMQPQQADVHAFADD